MCTDHLTANWNVTSTTTYYDHWRYWSQSFEARNLATQLYRFNSLSPRNTLHFQYENQMVKACTRKQSLPTVRITANSQMQYIVRPRSFINSKFRWYTLLPLRYNETWVELRNGIVTVLIPQHKETGWTNYLPKCSQNTLTEGYCVTWNSPLLKWYFQWLVYLKIERWKTVVPAPTSDSGLNFDLSQFLVVFFKPVTLHTRGYSEVKVNILGGDSIGQCESIWARV